jgi:hypothetical protein
MIKGNFSLFSHFGGSVSLGRPLSSGMAAVLLLGEKMRQSSKREKACMGFWRAISAGGRLDALAARSDERNSCSY